MSAGRFFCVVWWSGGVLLVSGEDVGEWEDVGRRVESSEIAQPQQQYSSRV